MSINPSIEQNQLQKTFIAMVFAFVISFHAQITTEFLAVLTNDWKSFPISSAVTLDFLAVFTQIVLALLMISISWVMWSKSQANAHLNDINQIFTVKFFTFLLEIILVTLYYGLAKSLEVNFSKFDETKDVSQYITKVSAQPETFLMIIIFAIFLIWDLITDLIKSPTNPVPRDIKGKIKSFFAGYIVYCSVSTVCLAVSLILFLIIPSESSVLVTIFSDLALICILFFFYQAKVCEYYGLKRFPEQCSRKNTNRNAPPTNWEKFRLILLSFLYILFLVMIGICIH